MPLLRKEIARLKTSPDNKELIELCLEMILKNHLYQEDVSSIYEMLKLQTSSSLRYAGLLALRSVESEWHDFSHLARVLDCSLPTAKELLTNKINIVTFPVVKNSEGNVKAELSSAIVIRLSEESVFIYSDKIKDLRRICSCTGKHFFVLFEADIVDRSYMLAIYAGLMIHNKELFEYYSFTGGITVANTVEICNHLEAKKECCDFQNRKLICGSFSLQDFLAWIETEDLPIPFAILLGSSARAGRDKLKKSIEKSISSRCPHFRWENLSTFTDLADKEALFVTDRDLTPDTSEWEELIVNKLKPLIGKILALGETDRRELHVFGSLSSIMFVAGVLVKDYISFSVYHYIQGEYKFVFSTKGSPRALKARKDINRFEKISYELSNPQNEMKVILFLASHDMQGATERYFKEAGISAGTIFIKPLDNQGNLPVDQDWSLYVNEIYNLLNFLKDKHNISKFHLFFGCPVAIAFSLGAAIGQYWDITAYQYDSINYSYYPVIRIKDLSG
jgi:hypothetical protein